jgi:hypothetical protein
LILIGTAVIGLSGCAGYQRQMACRDAAGPQPGAALQAFGVFGAIAMEAQPEWQDWNRRVVACVAGEAS